jgi:hypothetical protein
MIGLGGAEFRLPLLIGISSLVARQAVILNRAMSSIRSGSQFPYTVAARAPPAACRPGCPSALIRFTTEKTPTP